MEIAARILKEANGLFKRYGVRSVSMDDLAQHLGISKKTIYQHYEDKDTLITAAIQMEVTLIEGTCDQHYCQAANAIEEMFLVMRFVDQFFRNMNPSVLYDLEKFHPRAFQLIQNHKEKYFFEMVLKNLQRGIAEELYRPELNVDIITRFHVESSMLTFVPGLFDYQRYTVGEVNHELLEHYLYGIVSIKGHKMVLKYKQDSQKKLKHESQTA
jgi:TetR/AcrR family transcriptional regulator, cholesterol catabolism regulator